MLRFGMVYTTKVFSGIPSNDVTEYLFQYRKQTVEWGIPIQRQDIGIDQKVYLHEQSELRLDDSRKLEMFGATCLRHHVFLEIRNDSRHVGATHCSVPVQDHAGRHQKLSVDLRLATRAIQVPRRLVELGCKHGIRCGDPEVQRRQIAILQ